MEAMRDQRGQIIPPPGPPPGPGTRIIPNLLQEIQDRPRQQRLEPVPNFPKVGFDQNSKLLQGIEQLIDRQREAAEKIINAVGDPVPAHEKLITPPEVPQLRATPPMPPTPTGEGFFKNGQFPTGDLGSFNDRFNESVVKHNESLNTFSSNFSGYLESFNNIVKNMQNMPTEIKHTGNHTVQVAVTGLENSSDMESAVAKVATRIVSEKLSSFSSSLGISLV